MGRAGVVVLEPRAELSQDRFGIAHLGAVDVVTLEGLHERLRQAVALGAVRRRGDRHEAELRVNGKKIASYVAAFVLTYPNGREEWIELNGTCTAEARLKVALFRALFPNRLYRVVSTKGWS